MEKNNVINFDGLVRLIKQTPDMNFISFATTPWHIIGIEAALLWMQERGEKPDGLCLVVPHYRSGIVCDENTYKNEFSKKFLFISDKKRPYPFIKNRYLLMKFAYRDVSKKKKDENFYLAACYFNIDLGMCIYNLLRRRHIVHLITDEGVGTYLGTLEIECPRDTFRFSSVLKNPRYLSKWQHYRIWRYIDKHHEVKDLRLFFQDDDGSVRVNEEIAPFFKKAIENEASKTSNRLKETDLSDKVLLCTTAWIRDKIFDDEDYRVLRAVCDDLHRKGYEIFLKPHPRDNFFVDHAAELHAKVFDVPCSLEVLCAVNPPKAIVGYSSTALVTANLFWNIPAFCLCGMLDQSKLDILYQKESLNFSSVFKRYLILPQSLDDINI